MPDTAKTDSAAMRYILGTLSPEEFIRVEEELFFADDSKFAELELAEDELIQAYVLEQLPPEKMRQFEAKLSESPRLTERVNFARVLAEKFSPPVSPPKAVEPRPEFIEPLRNKGSWWERWFGFGSNSRLAFAACAGLVLVGGLVLAIGWSRLRNESSRLVAERAELERQREELSKSTGEQQNRANQLATEVQQMREEQAEDFKTIEDLQRKLKETGDQPLSVSSFATIFLTPGTLRSGGQQREVAIDSRTRLVRIQLALAKNDYPGYNAVLSKADQTQVIRKTALKPVKTGSGHVLFLSVPPQRLLPGDYVIDIEGVTTDAQVESVASYGFRVKRPS